MGSPGVFIHSGTLGGRLSALSLAPSASRPARPPAMVAPPSNAPPSRRNRRRDVEALRLSTSVGSVIVHHPPVESGAWNNTMKRQMSHHEDIISPQTSNSRPPDAGGPSALPGRSANYAAKIAAFESRVLVREHIGLDVAEGRFGLVFDAVIERLDD